jgi:hypothetical protein
LLYSVQVPTLVEPVPSISLKLQPISNAEIGQGGLIVGSMASMIFI